MRILFILLVSFFSYTTYAQITYSSAKCSGEIKPGYLDPSSYNGLGGLLIIDELSEDYSIDLQNIKSPQKIFDGFCNIVNNYDEDGHFYKKDNFSISVKHLLNCKDGSKECFYNLTISQNIKSNGEKYAIIRFNGSRSFKRTQWYLGDDFEIENWIENEVSDEVFNSCYENSAFKFCIFKNFN